MLLAAKQLLLLLLLLKLLSKQQQFFPPFYILFFSFNILYDILHTLTAAVAKRDSSASFDPWGLAPGLENLRSSCSSWSAACSSWAVLDSWAREGTSWSTGTPEKRKEKMRKCTKMLKDLSSSTAPNFLPAFPLCPDVMATGAKEMEGGGGGGGGQT